MARDPTTRKRGSKKAADHPRGTKVDDGKTGRLKPPMTIEEIVARDNEPASAPVPSATAARLSTRKVFFTAARGAASRIQKAIRAAKTDEGSVAISLPAAVSPGLPGNHGSRVDLRSLYQLPGGEKDGGPSKPDWVPLVYHPKLGARPQRKPLRRFDGRRVVPVNESFIYGSDDRRVYYPQGYPWHCIGKVEVFPNADSEYSTSWGSGVLIGDRLVLTAGHVPPENPPPGQWKMRFTAGLYNGSPVDGPGAISYVSDFNGYLGGVSGVDYAVLRLYEPLGVDLGYFGWKTYSSDWNGGDYWWLAGYPFDIAGAQSPSYQSGIAVLDEDSDNGGLEIEHQGDVASGDSGGPFWGFWGGEPYVVGTTSGHEVISGPSWVGGEDNNIAAGGGALSSLLNWGRTTWPL
jgi:V8-like Glu-specific endopeptidase